MKIFQTCVWLVVVLLSPYQVQAQSDSTAVRIGRKITFHSELLKEKRQVWIYTPPYYKHAGDSYPVLYLLDGESHFKHVASMVDYVSTHLRIPELIVVAVVNTDRVRDLTPLHSLEGLDGKVNEELFATTGGGDNFMNFLKKELVPYIDKNYRTQPYRLLEAHSLAGMFAFHVLQKSPDLFQSFIVISPAFYGKNKGTLETLPAFLKSHRDLNKRLYITIGDEPRLMRGYDSLVYTLKAYSPPSFLWKSKQYSDDDHGSVAHPSLDDGLRFIYHDWWMEALRDPETIVTDTQVQEHFKKLSTKYGYTIEPTEQLITSLGFTNLEMKRYDAAIANFQQAVAKFPMSAAAKYCLGIGFMTVGDNPSAIKQFEKCLELDPADANVKDILEKLKKTR